MLIETEFDHSLYYKSIENELNSLGVPMHVKGYHYLYQGIYFILKINSEDFKITKDLYPWLAKEYTTSAGSVEKSIRSTIDLTIMRGDSNKLKTYFSNDLFNDKITNKAFMIKIANEIKKMMS
jgi:two-component system response regulator (stage 0 sporulation protein A)